VTLQISTVIGPILGALLTFMILSYLLLGDNPFYRLAVHLFIGTLVGYSFGIVLRDIVIGMAIVQLGAEPLAVIVPVVLGILLILKGFPKHAHIGNLSIAYLVGVGTAVALSGALKGTLVPQVSAAGRALSTASSASFRLGLLDGLLMVVGTVCTLMAFNFTARQRQGLAGLWGRLIGFLAWVGRGFLIVALGVAFAGVLTAALSIFIGRVQYLIEVFTDFYFTYVGT